MSLFQTIRQMKLLGLECETSAAGGFITDDVHVQEVPKPKACALRVRSHARNRIRKAGGKVLTLAQLALGSPKRWGTVQPSGPAKAERCTGISQGPRNPARPF